MSSEIMDAYWQAPPLARNMATAIVVTSLSVHFNLISAGWVYFMFDRLWRIPPEIWRPFSSFLLSSPGLGIILDPYFTYQYLSQLEVNNPKFGKKEDVLWYLFTVGGLILVLARNFTGNVFFLQGLTLALCYTATQDQRGLKASFFFFTVPAQLVPYCMILASLLMNASVVPLQICGLLAAHMHDFLTRIYPEFGGGRNVLETPAFVSRLISTPRVVQRTYGTAIRGAAQGSASGEGSGPLPDAWKTRGTGHRLGGE